MIPTASGDTGYSAALDRYIDRLLDDALGRTIAASSAIAAPTRCDFVEKRSARAHSFAPSVNPSLSNAAFS